MKKIIKEIIDNNGYKITEESNENNQTIKRTTYNPDGVRIDWIEKYDPQTGNKIKKPTTTTSTAKKLTSSLNTTLKQETKPKQPNNTKPNKRRIKNHMSDAMTEIDRGTYFKDRSKLKPKTKNNNKSNKKEKTKYDKKRIN
ncbi:hypothetical Protein pso3_07450 [Candidatus Phytoplasma solani]|uniref:DUF2963 domain-containing protein n=1 Tax=Candidatus Phytoplasma solani TaxID=69896 RepID=UPI003A6BA134